MTISSQHLAKALWAAAALFAVVEWLHFFPSVRLTGWLAIGLIFDELARTGLYAGVLVALGAIVLLLGEIRDRLEAKG